MFSENSASFAYRRAGGNCNIGVGSWVQIDRVSISLGPEIILGNSPIFVEGGVTRDAVEDAARQWFGSI